eukprot:226387_1
MTIRMKKNNIMMGQSMNMRWVMFRIICILMCTINILVIAHVSERVPRWIISLHDVASRDIVATCDQSDLLECVYGEWQVVHADNDTMSMIMDEQRNVQNGSP